MSSNASELDSTRATRLAALKVAEDAELAAEEERRAKALKGGKGVGPEFMREQSKAVYGGTIGLEERLRRGRGALVREVE